MTQGTTPTISFSFDEDIDFTLIDYCEATFSQNGKNIIIKRLKRNYSDKVYECVLSEKDTLLLKPGTCKVQVKIKLKDGGIVATNIAVLTVNEILNGEVML